MKHKLCIIAIILSSLALGWRVYDAYVDYNEDSVRQAFRNTPISSIQKRLDTIEKAIATDWDCPVLILRACSGFHCTPPPLPEGTALREVVTTYGNEKPWSSDCKKL